MAHNSRIKKIIIKLSALIIALSFCLSYAEIALANYSSPAVDITGLSGMPAAPEITAPAIILMEAKSGAILYSRDANTAHYPASITKIMTALLTFENCSMDEVVTFSYRATHELEAGSSSIARTEGEQMTVKECLYALLIASANEVAQALAEHIAGSFEAFAEMMNERAAQLGCTNTHFSNPSGLQSEQHYTSCHDMALILRAAISLPEFVEMASTTTHVVPTTNKHDETVGIAMKHELLRGTGKYKYAVCGKTGYTSSAGFTLATYAKKDDMDLVCIAMNCDSSTQRASSTRNLFEWGFNNFSIYNIIESDASIKEGDEFLSDDSFLGSNMLDLSFSQDSYVVLPNDVSFGRLTNEFSWANDNEQGHIATLTYKCGDVVVGYAGLNVDADANDPYAFLQNDTYPELKNDKSLQKKELSPAVWIVPCAVVVALGVAFIVYRKVARRKRGKKNYHFGNRFR